MAAKPPVLMAMQLRSKNTTRIKRRKGRLSSLSPGGQIKKRVPPPTSSPKARGRRKKNPVQSPGTFDLIKDAERIRRFNQRNQAFVVVSKLRLPPRIPEESPPENVPPEECKDKNVKPMSEEEVNALISEAFLELDVVSKAVEDATWVIAEEAISEIALEVVNDAVEVAYSKTVVGYITEAIKEIAEKTLNEVVLKTITLPSSMLTEDQDKLQISEDDISSVLDLEEDDRLNGIIQILMEGDKKKIKEIQVRSTSDCSHQKVCVDNEDTEEINDSLSTPAELTFHALSSTQCVPFNISSSPNFTLCCDPPEPPPNMVLSLRNDIIPLFSLPILRSFVIRPEPPECITIRSRSSSPSSPRPPPLIPAPSLPPPPPLRPAPTKSFSRGPTPSTSSVRVSSRVPSASSRVSAPSTSSSHGSAPTASTSRGSAPSSLSSLRGPTNSISSSSESDPDYDPAPKPKKKRQRYKRKSVH